MDLDERFWNKVEIGENGNCWTWKGQYDKGYGRMMWKGGKHEYAHRIAWSLANKMEIPAGLVVMHECNNPQCVNPKHLRLGTQAENMSKMAEEGRSCAGELNASAKLTGVQVREILRLHGQGTLSRMELARLTGVHYNTIAKIVRKERWKHVENI